jgi:hypothetical protein
VRISFEKGGGDLRPSAGFPRSHRIESDASRGAHRIRPKLALLLQIPLRGKRNSPCAYAGQSVNDGLAGVRLAFRNQSLFAKCSFYARHY